MVEAAAGEKKPDKRQHPAVHAKDAMKVFDKVLKQSKTGAKGTHVRALMNPNSPQFNAKVKAAWDQLKKEERDEILRKQDQQLAAKQLQIKQVQTDKKEEQINKRAEKKFKAIDTDASGDISLDEMRAAMMNEQVFGSFTQGPASESQVLRLFEDMDVNRDGKISLTEFQAGLVRVFNQQEEEFWGSFHAKDATVLDLTKKQNAASSSAASSASSASFASPAAAAGTDTSNTVSDALAKLNALSASAKGRLGADATAATKPGNNALSSFRESALEDLRKQLRGN